MIIEITCKTCGRTFKTQDYKTKQCKSRGKSVRKFCSQKCYRLWRKKFYKPTQATKDKTSESLKGRPATGKPFKKGHKINNGREPWNKGLVLKDYFDTEIYEKFVEGCRKGAVATYITVANPKHRTKIELKIEEFLKELGIKYMSQYAMMGLTVPDFYIPNSRLVIYADGDYWHNYPHGNKRDHYIKKELENNNYIVLRFWETDINNDFNLVKQKIKEKL